jgi:hypothetical protein
MHFHVMAECKNCGVHRVFSTPIPDILILSSICEDCGTGDLVGRYPENRCFRCDQQRLVDIERKRTQTDLNDELAWGYVPK